MIISLSTVTVKLMLDVLLALLHLFFFLLFSNYIQLFVFFVILNNEYIFSKTLSKTVGVLRDPQTVHTLLLLPSSQGIGRELKDVLPSAPRGPV